MEIGIIEHCASYRQARSSHNRETKQTFVDKSRQFCKLPFEVKMITREAPADAWPIRQYIPAQHIRCRRFAVYVADACDDRAGQSRSELYPIRLQNLVVAA